MPFIPTLVPKNMFTKEEIKVVVANKKAYNSILEIT